MARGETHFRREENAAQMRPILSLYQVLGVCIDITFPLVQILVKETQLSLNSQKYFCFANSMGQSCDL
jgi:hypothetical protein